MILSSGQQPVQRLLWRGNQRRLFRKNPQWRQQSIEEITQAVTDYRYRQQGEEGQEGKGAQAAAAAAGPSASQQQPAQHLPSNAK